MKLLLWMSLTLSLLIGILAVWVFWWLKQGIPISPDSSNEVEFWMASVILLIQFVAWIWFIIKMLRYGKL